VTIQASLCISKSLDDLKVEKITHFQHCNLKRILIEATYLQTPLI
jgi:hypothetical protein